jgi:hypothetical protein
MRVSWRQTLLVCQVLVLPPEALPSLARPAGTLPKHALSVAARVEAIPRRGGKRATLRVDSCFSDFALCAAPGVRGATSSPAVKGSLRRYRLLRTRVHALDCGLLGGPRAPRCASRFASPRELRGRRNVGFAVGGWRSCVGGPGGFPTGGPAGAVCQRHGERRRGAASESSHPRPPSPREPRARRRRDDNALTMATAVPHIDERSLTGERGAKQAGQQRLVASPVTS